MIHCVKLDYPRLTDDQHQEILDLLDANRPHPRVVSWLADKDIEFTGILQVPGMKELLGTVLQTSNSYIFENTCIQQLRSISNKPNWTLEPHPDLRQVGLLYTIEGPADSVWYTIDKPLTPNTSYQAELEQGKLKVSQRFTMDLHTWYLYDHGNIHSVVNGQGRRTSIAVGLTWRFKTFQNAFDQIVYSKDLIFVGNPPKRVS